MRWRASSQTRQVGPPASLTLAFLGGQLWTSPDTSLSSSQFCEPPALLSEGRPCSRVRRGRSARSSRSLAP
eukprot:COSAG03_NODE_1388_length_4182_cov_1.931423_7_plen_71_part_00